MKTFDNARQWIGYLEHLTPDNLADFKANPGKGYYTIFGLMIQITQGINLQGLPWCATFVHAVINRPDILGKAHPGTRVLARRMKRKRLWRKTNYIPQPGDLMFCTNQPDTRRRINHVAIVDHVENGIAYTVDGNTHDPSGVFEWEQGGAVDMRKRALDDPHIIGYAAIGELIRK